MTRFRKITHFAKRHWCVIGFLIWGWFTFLWHAPFLVGKRLFFHDNLAILTAQHSFFDSLFQGTLLLWNPHLNAGTPFWTSAEMIPILDPVLLVVWGVSYLTHGSSQLAYQWTSYLWLLIFVLGGVRLSRRYSANRLHQLIVFTILFGAPMLSGSIMAQTHLFLAPFRYLPWILLALISYLNSPSVRGGLWLAWLLGISNSGYQTPYAALFILLFAVFYLSLRRTGFSKFAAIQLWLPSAVLLAVMYLPTFIAGLEWLELYPSGRGTRVGGYSIGISQFFGGLIDKHSVQPSWHGHSFVGISALFFIFIAIPFSARRFRRHGYLPAVNLFLLPIAIVVAIFSTDLLMLRNWGDWLTLVVLLLALLVATGLSAVKMFFPRERSDLVALGLLLVLVFEFTQFFASTLRHGQAPESFPVALPRLGHGKISFYPVREWEFPVMKYWPYVTESGLLFNHPSATIVDDIDPIFQVRTVTTHYFELPHYHDLRLQERSTPRLSAILGFSKPIVQFAKDLEVESLMSEDSLALGELVKFGANGIQISVETKSSGYLVYKDGWDPHWNAYVDGSRVPIVRAHGVNKAVAVDAGKHLVEFEYWPAAYLISFWARLVVLLAIPLVLAAGLVRRLSLGLWKAVPSHA